MRFNPWFIILCLTILLVCKKEQIQTVTIPEKSGSFGRDSTELKPVVRYDTIREDGQTKIIKIENPVNQTLLDKYKSLKDSVARLEQYKEAITERTYQETYEDSTQEITVESKVIGTLKSQKVAYKIFPQEIEVKQKKRKYSIYAGLKTTIQPQQNFEPNLTLQSPKMLYSVGYSINQKAVTVGVSFKVL